MVLTYDYFSPSGNCSSANKVRLIDVDNGKVSYLYIFWMNILKYEIPKYHNFQYFINIIIFNF